MKRWLAKVKRSFTGWSARLGKIARWMGGLSATIIAGLAAAFPSAANVHGLLAPLLIGALVGLFVAPLFWLAGWVAKVLGRRRDAALRVVEGALEVSYTKNGKTQRFEPAELVSGMVLPLVPDDVGDPRAELRLVLANGDRLRLSLGTVEEADALVDALALGPGQRRLVFGWARIFNRILSAFGAYILTAMPLFGLAAGLEGTGSHVPLAFISLVAPFLAAGWASRLWRREVVAGTDGVEARVGLRRESVRFADVEEMTIDPEGVVFDVGGEKVRIPFDMDDRRQAQALGHRLELAWEHFQRAVGSGGVERFLRGDLSLEAWKEKLARLLQGAATMREAPLRVEDAYRVLEDPEADPEARAGAALALAATGGDEDRQRVRVAVEATTSPKVRVALDAALEGELEEELLKEARAEHAAD